MDQPPQEPPSESSPLVTDNRTAIRNSALQTVLQLSDHSRVYLAIKFLISLCKIVACFLILFLTSRNVEKPLDTFIYIMVSIECVYALVTIMNFSIPPAQQHFRLKRIIGIFEYLALLTYIVGHILGNVWFYSCDSCFDDARELTILSLVLIVLGYVYMCMPCLLCCCVCMCLPVLIIALMYANPGQHPASEDQISKLKVVNFNSAEHVNKECVICFAAFELNDEIMPLNCDVRHSFHSACLKRWLRINNTCPICRKPLE